MATYKEPILVPPSSLNSTYSWGGNPVNKYIFLNQNNHSSQVAPRILVNPHFRDNNKVFINPHFSIDSNISTSQTSIYINPNIIKPVQSTYTPLSNTIPFSGYPVKRIPAGDASRVIVSTKNKLIKFHETGNHKLQNVCNPVKTLSSSTAFEKKNPDSSSTLNKTKVEKMVSTRMKIVNIPVQSELKLDTSLQRNSIITKFKYIKNRSLKKVHKIVKSNDSIADNVTTSQNYKQKESNSRKKYLYVNKYYSSSFLANNVILKNTRQSHFINVNGILYRNSPSVMKRTHFPSKPYRHSNNVSSNSKTSCVGKTAINKNTPSKLKRGSLLVTAESRYKFVRPRIASVSKLKKCNLSCKTFKQFGKCNGQKNGKCIKVHNPDQIVLCTKFLQGACIKKTCSLSHKVSPEKMPTCKYYLEGLCTRDDCQYLHVKISPKAAICKNFLEGFCERGRECDKRHQFLCPDFEMNQKCSKKRCEYPHLDHSIKKSIKKRNRKPEANKVTQKLEVLQTRYYDEMESEDKTRGQLISRRPKLGSLPVFIPFTKET